MEHLLIFFRHGEKNPDGSLSAKGKAQARASAQALKKIIVVERVFCGAISRTKTAAEEFAEEYCGDKSVVTGPIEGIGDDEMVARFATPAVKTAIKNAGLSNFEAGLQELPKEILGRIAARARAAISRMFEDMEENGITTGVAFGHSPFIECAAWLTQQGDLPEEFRTLRMGEAIIFMKSDDREIVITDKLPSPEVPDLPPAA